MFETIIEGILLSLANHPMAAALFALAGTLLVIASTIDSLLPDEKDHGFSKKLFEIPILGLVLKQLMRFSILRTKKPGEKE